MYRYTNPCVEVFAIVYLGLYSHWEGDFLTERLTIIFLVFYILSRMFTLKFQGARRPSLVHPSTIYTGCSAICILLILLYRSIDTVYTSRLDLKLDHTGIPFGFLFSRYLCEFFCR